MVERHRPLATHRAIRVASDTGALPRHAQDIEPQQTAFERLSGAGQELQDACTAHCRWDERRRDAGVGLALGKAISG